LGDPVARGLGLFFFLVLGGKFGFLLRTRHRAEPKKREDKVLHERWGTLCKERQAYIPVSDYDCTRTLSDPSKNQKQGSDKASGLKWPRFGMAK
jgi:hypothetical protein